MKLLDACEMIVDCPHSTAKDEGIGYPLIRTPNIGKGRLKLVDVHRVCQEVYDKRNERAVPKTNDLILAREAPVGNVAIIKQGQRVCLGQRTVLIRPNAKIVDPDYLVYYLLSPNSQQKLISASNGATVSHLNMSSIRNLDVFFPELETQKQIGKILTLIDDKIELNTSINENLEQQAQAIFKSWFVDFEPFGGVMPKNWEKSDIYSIANIIYGAPFSSKLFNTQKLGKPIIRIRDLKEQAFVTYTTEIHPKGHLIQSGDIVVGMDGEFRPYIWGNTAAWLNQRVCIFENKNPNDKAFTLFTIKPLLNVIEQTQVATTVIHIGKKDFDAFNILLPDKETRDIFGSITTPMINQIVNNCLENQRLSALRDNLLPKLMNGEIDVSNVKI